MHQVLLDAAAADLPAAGVSGRQNAVTAWWELPESARYLREHLIEHLIAAGRPQVAEAVSCDLRWAGSQLEQPARSRRPLTWP